MGFAFIDRKQDLEVVFASVRGGVGRQRITVNIHRLRQGVRLRESGGAEYRHADVLDAGRIGEVAQRLGMGLELRDVRLHDDGDKAGRLDCHFGLDRLEFRLVAGDEAYQQC